MAVKAWTIEHRHSDWIIASCAVENGDTSQALELPHYPNKTLHYDEAAATTTDLDIKGSNVDSTPKTAASDAKYQDLHRGFITDGGAGVSGADATFTNLTASVLAKIRENPRYIKITAYASDAETTVYIVATK